MEWQWHYVWQYREALWNGFLVTLELNIFVFIIGSLLGILVALFRISTNRVLIAFGRGYVDVFRSLPVLVLLVWLFFALPLFPLADFRISPMAAAVIGLSINLSAFVAEIVRAGIVAVPERHVDAAKVIGMSKWVRARYIAGPIALRLMLPPLFGQYISQVKLSVLASVIAVPEILHAVNTISTEAFRPLEFYTVLAAVFLFLLLPATLLQARLEEAHKASLRVGREIETDEQWADQIRLKLPVEWSQVPNRQSIELRNVTVGHGNRIVVDDVSCSIDSGKVTAVLGANGCGKTTLLRVIAGLQTVKSGTIEIHNGSTAKRVSDMPTTGFMFQEYEPWPHLSVEENLALPLRNIRKLPPEEAHREAHEWLRFISLESRCDDKPIELSGGQRQRLVLARTLCLRPSVVLFDEPTSAMDFRWVLSVQRMLRQLADIGVTVIVVSHGIGLIRSVADDVLFLDGGRLREAGQASQLLRNPGTREFTEYLAAA